MAHQPFFRFFPSKAVNPDSPMLIGGESPNRAITLTRVWLSKGELVFGEETQEVFKTHEFPSATTCIKGERGNHSWVRIQYQAIKEHADIRAGEQLVLALLPFSREGVIVATFKNGHRGERKDPTANAEADVGPADAIRILEQQRQDFVEKRPELLTAGISAFSEYALEKFKREALACKRQGVWQPQPQYALGVCANFERYRAKLLKHKRAKNLISLARKNQLNFSRQDSSKGSGKIPKLSPDIIESLDNYALAAAGQALAGPVEASAEWVGRPVLDYFDHRFRNILNDANRRLQNKRKHEMPLGEAPLKDTSALCPEDMLEAKQNLLQCDRGEAHEAHGWDENGEPWGAYWEDEGE